VSRRGGCAAERVLNRPNCDVLLIRPRGFKKAPESYKGRRWDVSRELVLVRAVLRRLFDALNWAGIAVYKLGIILLNLVPLAALYLAFA
jgi:hypothetical protein